MQVSGLVNLKGPSVMVAFWSSMKFKKAVNDQQFYHCNVTVLFYFITGPSNSY